MTSWLSSALTPLQWILLAAIPPRPSGYERNREDFRIRTGLTFDAIGAGEATSIPYLQMPGYVQPLLFVAALAGSSTSGADATAIVMAVWS